MKYFLSLFGIISLGLLSCNDLSKDNSVNNVKTIDALITNLEDSENDQIIVVAHRGDWRNAPENSLQAIQNCIDKGVDMVEIDIQQTKDGQLVLMHDKTIDRTSNGQGFVMDFTLDSLKSFQLLDIDGKVTSHKIPTLEDALLLAKDEILVNLDKSYSIFDNCFKVIKETNTLHQVIIKGTKTRGVLESEFESYLDEVYFMPIVRLSNSESKTIVDDYLKNRVPVAFEFILPQDTFTLINHFDDIREQGSSIWVNALWDQLNGGHSDEQAKVDPSVYDWYIENNVDIIQTDNPFLLIEYLRSKGLHQ